MKAFRDWGLRSKLVLLVGVFVAGFAITALVALRTMQTIRVGGPAFNSIALAKDLAADVEAPPLFAIESYLATHQLSVELHEKDRAEERKRCERTRAAFESKLAEWSAKLGPHEADLKKLLVEKVGPSGQKFFEARDREFLPALERGDRQRANELLAGRLQDLFDEHFKDVQELTAQLEKHTGEQVTQVGQLVKARSAGLLALIACFVVLGALVGVAFVSSVARRLRESVSLLATSSMQLGATIEEQERTAVGQAAAVNQSAAAMDELDASFRQTAGIVDASASATAVSMDEMQRLRERMGVIADQILGLSEQTNQIGGITRLVGDLANQTNMLALNAAVEAARAGEHGKGFAVVSAEIRKLADESKKSAERINAIVEDIQKATNATVMAAEESSKALTSVSGSLHDAASAAQQTLLNVRQQVSAVQQISQAMETLSTGARETAAGLSQARGGMEGLRTAAEQLQAVV